MKVIMLMFDTLNRRFLPPYGNDWVQAPNFERLAQLALTFDRSYVGSMPTIPARRELHTGRYNFLHRSWGPLEPYDDSLTEMLRHNGVYCHLVSDNYHYWEDGGATYHQRYSTWHNHRGQEGEHWKPHVAETSPLNWDLHIQDKVNRQYLTSEELQPQTLTVNDGLEFLDINHDEDRWFLQIETFDPHEPFYSMAHYKALYPNDYQGPDVDWPPYGPVTEPPEVVRRMRNNYAALITMCDRSVGRVLDAMDRLDLWDDTMLIVNTDHGLMLGEHGWWAKGVMPFYNEIVHTPLFIWDPRSRRQGEHSPALVQTIDMGPTLLEFFGIDRSPDMEGVPLGATIADDTPARKVGLFGTFGRCVNITDGRYVYMRAPASEANAPLYEYTVMPTRMRGPFGVAELSQATLHPPFTFTKNVPVLRVPVLPLPEGYRRMLAPMETLLFDLEADPAQDHPIEDPAVEARLVAEMVRLMQKNDAPPEQYERLGLGRP